MQILLLKSFAGDDPEFEHLIGFSRKIDVIRKLSFEECQKYLKEAQAGNLESRERVFKSFLPMVMSLSKKYTDISIQRDPSLTPLDLINAGAEGLLKAIDKYKFRGHFVNYAEFYIKGYIMQLRNDSNGNLQTSHVNTRRLRLIEDFQNEFYKVNQRKPTIPEIAENLGLSLLEIKNSMNGKISRAQVDCYAEHLNLPDPNVDLERESINAELRQNVIGAIFEVLNPKERFVAVKYFGLGRDSDSWSYKEIGEYFGSSKQYIKIFFDKYIVPKLTQRLKATAQQYL